MRNKEYQEYFKNKYFNIDDNYKVILSKIKKEKKINKMRFLKMVASILIVIIGAAGVVLASTTIYNKYIKENREVNIKGTYDPNEMTALERTMELDRENNIYYKVVTDAETYKRYKDVINLLPEIEEINFEENFIIIIPYYRGGSLNRVDWTISEVTADANVTYINLEQKENPNYDENNFALFAIVNKELLRDQYKLNAETPYIRIQGTVNIEDLPKDYSLEDAINDGCFVVDDEGKVLSNDIYEIDKFIENAENGIESQIRIYIYRTEPEIYYMEYNNGFFVRNYRHFGRERIHVMVDKYLVKRVDEKNNEYIYGFHSNQRAVELIKQHIEDCLVEESILNESPSLQSILLVLPIEQFEKEQNIE